MRFISQYAGYGAQIRVQRQEGRGDGSVAILTPGLYVKFRSLSEGAFIFDNERMAALNHFAFRGNTQDLGEAAPTDPMNRLSVMDTDEQAQSEGWSEEDKGLVEARLMQISETTPEEVLYIASPPMTAPFPAYDHYSGTPQDLVLKLIEDEHDLDTVLHYERTFGPKREEIIAELETAIEARNEVIVQA